MLCFRRKEGRKPSKRSLNFYIELCISYFNNCLAIKKEKVLEFPCCAHYSYFSLIIYYMQCTKNFFFNVQNYLVYFFHTCGQQLPASLCVFCCTEWYVGCLHVMENIAKIIRNLYGAWSD